MIDPDTLAWDKMGGLLPAIVQDSASGEVAMLGYMDRAALDATRDSGFVTFYSRSRQALWTKGETSGNRLELVDLAADCDGDALLVRARPRGPVCHRGTRSCFGDATAPSLAFLERLEAIQAERCDADPALSYTARLWASGLPRIAQKVGEEGVEAALAAVTADPDALVGEAADLLVHLLLLLRARGKGLADVVGELARRHADSSATASS